MALDVDVGRQCAFGMSFCVKSVGPDPGPIKMEYQKDTEKMPINASKTVLPAEESGHQTLPPRKAATNSVYH